MQETQTYKLELTSDELNGLLGVLGELPTKFNLWPLVMKIKQQAEQQHQPAEEA